jgi:hypothetical protein
LPFGDITEIKQYFKMLKLQVLKAFNASLAYLLILLFFVVHYRSQMVHSDYILNKILYFTFVNLLPAIILILVSLFSRSFQGNVAATIIGGVFILINYMVQGVQLGYIEI